MSPARYPFVRRIMPSPLDVLTARNFQIKYLSHAHAILHADFLPLLEELGDVLSRLEIPVTALVGGGGGETLITQGIRRALADRGWRKHKFEIQKLIDGQPRQSISHEVDHVRILENGTVAIEIEWNNKDPFYDRDLENFKRLHAEGVISAGIIVTRGKTLQDTMKANILKFAQDNGITCYDDLVRFRVRPTDRQREAVDRRMRTGESFPEAWADVFCNDKYGQATTHWRKLEDRVQRGVGNPCPLLLIGIPHDVVIH